MPPILISTHQVAHHPIQHHDDTFLVEFFYLSGYMVQEIPGDQIRMQLQTKFLSDLVVVVREVVKM